MSLNDFDTKHDAFAAIPDNAIMKPIDMSTHALLVTVTDRGVIECMLRTESNATVGARVLREVAAFLLDKADQLETGA